MADEKASDATVEDDESRPTLLMPPRREIGSFDELVFEGEDLIAEVGEIGEDGRVPLATEDRRIEASLVLREGDLESLDLTWEAASGLPFPAPASVLIDLYERAFEAGYPISLLLRRVAASQDELRYVERHVVVFDPEPQEGDGAGVTIEVALGLDLGDEDFGPPHRAVRLRDQWVERVRDLVTETYPRATLRVEVVDEEREDINVEPPPGLDATDFEWVLEDLLDQARDELLEP